MMADLNRISREVALETRRLGEQARLRFDETERLAAERLALVRELQPVRRVGRSGDGPRVDSASSPRPLASGWMGVGRTRCTATRHRMS